MLANRIFFYLHFAVVKLCQTGRAPIRKEIVIHAFYACGCCAYCVFGVTIWGYLSVLLLISILGGGFLAFLEKLTEANIF